MTNLSTISVFLRFLQSKWVYFLFIFCFFAPFDVSAARPNIVINEIAWMGTGIDGIESKSWWRYEWAELYNNTSDEITLNGWEIDLYQNDLDWSLELKGKISPNGYFLIASSNKIANYDLNYSNLGGKFVNSGQKVILKNELGESLDEVNCLSGWFAGDNSTKQTMERINPEISGNDPKNWETSKNVGGTPKNLNSVFGLTAEKALEEATKSSSGFVSNVSNNENTKAKESKKIASAEESIGKSFSALLFLAAFGIAIFSGVVIFSIKKFLKNGYL